MALPLGPDPALIALLEKLHLPTPRCSSEKMLQAIAAELKRLGWPRHWPTEPRSPINHGNTLTTETQRRRKYPRTAWEMSPEGKERIRAAQHKRWEMHRERLEAG